MQPNASTAVPLDAAEAIARLYRRLVLLVGAQILLGFVIQARLVQLAGPMVGAFISIVLLIVLVCILAMLATTAYKLTGYLDAGTPILWAIGMFIPCVNILILLVLSSKVQAWCKQYGIKVGFLGPTPESIEEVRRRAVTSKFE